MTGLLAHTDNDGRDPANPPAMPFLVMQPGLDGRSTISQAALAEFAMASVSGDAAPIWMRKFAGTVKAVWFNILPVGWIGELHPSPALQWVVPLSGRWFIETQDGQRVEMGPGEIHWGEDLAEAGTHPGVAHRSGQLGDVPCVQMMVQFECTDEAGFAGSAMG
ncbi:hypothetical protein [Massilia sp. HP4]|uniref:hypothetical protein n=1 Tax=Massilia sp. HP4 TaxID=2562316 RepID=UPI0010C0EDEB|nr:hypothetical protein [Massilia sp. HP4]